jgi:hypothetical protein
MDGGCVLGIRHECVVYCLNTKSAGKTPEQRQLEMLDSVRSWGGKVEDRLIERNGTRRTDLLDVIQQFRQRGKSFVLVVSNWDDVAHPNVAQALVDSRVPVVISEKAGKIRGQVDENGWLVGGPVVNHTLDINRLLKAYLDGLSGKKKGSGSSIAGVNDERHKEAHEFALSVWPAIKKTALRLGTTNQAKIATAMHEAGQRSKKGCPFTQPLLSRIIQQAQKSQEWVELCIRIEGAEPDRTLDEE